MRYMGRAPCSWPSPSDVVQSKILKSIIIGRPQEVGEAGLQLGRSPCHFLKYSCKHIVGILQYTSGAYFIFKCIFGEDWAERLAKCSFEQSKLIMQRLRWIFFSTFQFKSSSKFQNDCTWLSQTLSKWLCFPYSFVLTCFKNNVHGQKHSLTVLWSIIFDYT